MYKALIIDDEPLARSVVHEYLAGHTEIEVLADCNDGFEGVKAITQHQPDLIFLDIQMPKITGFEMLELIDNPPDVIFTTAFDEFAIKAFESHAVDYLLKPFSKERFNKAIEKWKAGLHKDDSQPNVNALLEAGSRHTEEGNRVVVKEGSAIKIIPSTEIHYLEAFDDYVKIHTKDGFHLKKKTMNYFEGVLDRKEFVRVHRSFIVNLKQLTRFEPLEKETYIVVLRSGVQVPMSKSGHARLKEVLNI
jgi:two-component system LytT family response regulator